jgi:hypothetical protein
MRAGYWRAEPLATFYSRGLKMKYLTVLVALLLAGCMTREERIAAQSAKDDQKCLAYGARPGTDAYVNCRAQLDSARTTADAIEDAAPTANPNPVPASDAPKLQPMTIPGPRCTSRGC